jgi:hypothetical protein
MEFFEQIACLSATEPTRNGGIVIYLRCSSNPMSVETCNFEVVIQCFSAEYII